MKPAQEKAKELVDKHRTYLRMADKYGYLDSEDEIYLAKQCALISVDEIINNGNLEPQLKRHIGNVEPNIIHLEYWFKVKHELNNL